MNSKCVYVMSHVVFTTVTTFLIHKGIDTKKNKNIKNKFKHNVKYRHKRIYTHNVQKNRYNI